MIHYAVTCRVSVTARAIPFWYTCIVAIDAPLNPEPDAEERIFALAEVMAESVIVDGVNADGYNVLRVSTLTVVQLEGSICVHEDQTRRMIKEITYND